MRRQAGCCKRAVPCEAVKRQSAENLNDGTTFCNATGCDWFSFMEHPFIHGVVEWDRPSSWSSPCATVRLGPIQSRKSKKYLNVGVGNPQAREEVTNIY